MDLSRQHDPDRPREVCPAAVEEAGATENPTRRHIVFLGDTSPGAWRLAPLAAGLAGVPPSPQRVEQPLDPDLELFYQKLFGLHDLRVSRYRVSVLRRRKAACLRALRVADLAEGGALLASGADAAHRALRAVMIGVTAFFRDPMVFEALGTALTTQAARRRSGPRVLSIGCSNGSELYSVAILLSELGLEPPSLLGVDCREMAIRTARAGVYPPQSLESVPRSLVRRYFEPYPAGGSGAARVIREIRDRCRWRRADAFDLADGPVCDLILCRNLFIYLTPVSAAELWRKLTVRLSDGGLLLVGKAERPASKLGLRRIGKCLYQKLRTVP